LRYHLYLPDAGYELQGPTYETERPLDERQRQLMLDKFFDWMRGDQELLKMKVGRGQIRAQFRGGEGWRPAWVERIESRQGFSPPEGLTAKEYDDIFKGRYRKFKKRDYYVRRDKKGRFKKWILLREVK